MGEGARVSELSCLSPQMLSFKCFPISVWGAGEPWASDLNFLSLSFFIYKMGIIAADSHLLECLIGSFHLAFASVTWN